MAETTGNSQRSVIAHLRQLGGQSVIYGAGLAATQGLGFLLLPLVTRYLPPSEFGLVSVMLSVGVVFGILFSMGIDSAALRHYFDYQEGEPLRRHLGAIFLFMTAADLAFSLLLFGFARPLARLVFGDAAYSRYLALMVCSTFFKTGAAIPLSVVRAREQASLFTFYSVGSAVFSRGSMVLMLIFWRHDALAYLVGTLIGDAGFYLVFLRFMLHESSLPGPGARQSIVRSVRFGAPLVPHQLSGWILGVIDRIMLQRLANFAAAGIYSAGSSVGMIMNLFGQGLSYAWSPFLYRIHAEDPQNADRAAARLVSHYVSFVTLVAITLSVASREVIHLMVAPAYHKSREIVPLIVAGYWAQCMYYIPVSYLFLEERTSALPLLTAGAALLNILANLLWIPALGMMGCGWAKVVAYGALATAVTVYGQRVHKVPYEWGRLARIALAGVIVTLAGEWVVRRPWSAELSLLVRAGLVFAFLALLVLSGVYPIGTVLRLRRSAGAGANDQTAPPD